MTHFCTNTFLTERKATSPPEVPRISSPGSHHSIEVMSPALARRLWLRALSKTPCPFEGRARLRQGLPGLRTGTASALEAAAALAAASLAEEGVGESEVGAKWRSLAKAALAFFSALLTVDTEADRPEVHTSREKACICTSLPSRLICSSLLSNKFCQHRKIDPKTPSPHSPQRQRTLPTYETRMGCHSCRSTPVRDQDGSLRGARV